MFIGRDNRYEHEVTPLGGTRMRIPVAARKLLCSEVLLGLISMVVPIRRHGGLLSFQASAQPFEAESLSAL